MSRQSDDQPTPVTTIFARVVRPGSEPQYEEWLAGISSATSEFAGNKGTTILRPAEGRDEYISITQFDTQENLDSWLESPERASWLAKLESIDICREQVMSLAGMERWFTLPSVSDDRMPPRYKTAVLILLGLYPLVLLLQITLDPFLTWLPRLLQVLVSLIVSIVLMVWVVLPLLTKLFSRWLHPRHKP